MRRSSWRRRSARSCSPTTCPARTPHLRQQINGHGYLAVTAEPDAVTAEFKVLRDVQDPRSRIRTEATWQVRAGNPRARPVEA